MSDDTRKILLISYAFPPLGAVGSLRPFRFAKYLTEFGWNPVVLTIRERKDVTRDYSLLDELPPGVEIVRTSTFDPYLFYKTRQQKRDKPGEYTQENSVGAPAVESSIVQSLSNRMKRFVSVALNTPDHQLFWFAYAFPKAASIIRKGRVKAIVTTSPPHSEHLIGLALKKVFGVPWVADFRDPWSHNFMLRDITQGQVRIEQQLEKMVMRNADRVIANTETNRIRLVEVYKDLDPSKFVTVHNGFESRTIPATEDFRDKFTIAHTGIFYPMVQPYFFLRAISKWLNVDGDTIRKKIRILLVGSDDEDTKRAVHAQGIEDVVTFISRVPHMKALEIAASSDVLLLSLGFDPSHSGWVPMKLYDYLGCKKPLLAFLPEGEAAAIIRKTESGYVFTGEDMDNTVERLRGLYALKFSKGDEPIKGVSFSGQKMAYEVKFLTGKVSDVLWSVTR